MPAFQKAQPSAARTTRLDRHAAARLARARWPALLACVARARRAPVASRAAPYESLNLGDHVGDDPACVAENRRRFASALGARPVFLQQVHGARRGAPGRRDARWHAGRCVLDHASAASPARSWWPTACPCCWPMRRAGVVGAAHCGWRGLAGGVLEALWSAMRAELAGTPAEVVAWLGPCIGPDAFEVGAEVREAFIAGRSGSRVLLPAAGRRQVPGRPAGARAPTPARARASALSHGNDGSTAWCTVANPSRFFSHRRDRVSGRFAAACWLG